MRTDPRRDLMDRREKAQQLLAALARDFDEIVDAAQSVSTDDEHDPEGTTIAFERAQVDAMLTRTRRQIDELDQAIARFDDGTYGVCQRCGMTIPADRLHASLAASTCVGCAG